MYEHRQSILVEENIARLDWVCHVLPVTVFEVLVCSLSIPHPPSSSLFLCLIHPFWYFSILINLYCNPLFHVRGNFGHKTGNEP